jgi:hypothetical protein
MAMRGKAEMFVGKNTMVRFVIKKFGEEHKNQALFALADELEGNVALIFTNEDLRDVCVSPLQSHNRIPIFLFCLIFFLMRVLRSAPSFLQTARRRPLVSAASPSAPSSYLLVPLAWSPPRPPSSRPCRSPPRSTRAPLRSCLT